MKKILLLALLLIGVMSTSTLRADASADEKKAAGNVHQALDDGTFTVVQDRGTTFLKKYPTSELAPQVRLDLAQAQYQLGRSEDALSALNLPDSQIPPDLAPEFLFWQAESLLNLGRWPEAEQKYRSLLLIQNHNSHLDAANLGLAWALYKEDKEADALAILNDLTAKAGTSTAGMEARLTLAKIALSKKQEAEAAQQLQTLLATNPDAPLKYEANYWLGESYSALGKYELAAAAYQNITAAPKAYPKLLVAQAHLGLGQVQHDLNQEDKAMLSYERTYQLAENEKVQLAAFQMYLQSARASQQFPDAVTHLNEYMKTNDAARPNALFAIASALYEDHSDDNKAIGILETLLITYDKAVWRPAAQDLLGQLFLRTHQDEPALQAFQACLDSNPDPDLTRDATFNIGLIFFQQNKFSEAVARFDKVAAGSNDALAQSAAYNLILAQVRLNQGETVSTLMADFLKRFPKSTYRTNLAIAQGDLLASQSKNEAALAAYQAALTTNSTEPNQAVLLRHVADFQYQIGDREDAVKTYQQIVAQFPNDSLEAAQRGLLAKHELKKLSDDQYEHALLDLGQKYSRSPQAAEIFFRLGEYYYYRQDYVKAQSILQQLAITYPESSYADNALYFAGHAAAAHQDYASALTLFGKVPDGSPFKADAQLGEGIVDQKLLKFDQALNQYNRVLATEKTGAPFVEANLRKGECLFALADKDSDAYARAADACTQILNSKEGTIAQRDEAAVRKAKCLWALGKTPDALGLYIDVLYGRVAGQETANPQAADFTWQIQGGCEAERILESQKDWRGAIEIYKRLEQIGGVHQEQFHNSINKLRRDNYIYD